MKSFISGKKRVLLLIETSRAFGRGLLQGISHHSLEHDEWIVHVEDRGLLEAAPSWLKSWRGDGIIARSSSYAMARWVRSMKVPFVELLGNGKGVAPEVRNDEDRVAELAADLFFHAGFEHYAFFAIGNAWWSDLRQKGFQREVQKRQGRLHVFPGAGKGPRMFYPVWDSRFDRQILAWLRKLPKPVGIWSVSDAWAVRLLEACRRESIPVPEEVAILGTTNDILLCGAVGPALSSIDLNSFQIGYVAAERLRKKMNKEPLEPVPILVPPIGITERRSTDIVAFPDPLLAEAIQFMRDNASRGITIDDVTEQVGLSRSSLQRRFRRMIGHTIEKELIKVKMDRAKRLLRETTFTLSSIAIKSGFSTTDYFVQAFRRENKMTPHQYRKKVQAVPARPERVPGLPGGE